MTWRDVAVSDSSGVRAKKTRRKDPRDEREKKRKTPAAAFERRSVSRNKDLMGCVIARGPDGDAETPGASP